MGKDPKPEGQRLLGELVKQKEGEGKDMGFGVGFGNVNSERWGWRAPGNSQCQVFWSLYGSNGKQEITGLNFHKEWVEGRPTGDRWKIVASLQQ